MHIAPADRTTTARVGLMCRLALAVDPRVAGPLAGCSRHYPSARIAPPPGAAQRPNWPMRPQAWGPVTPVRFPACASSSSRKSWRDRLAGCCWPTWAPTSSKSKSCPAATMRATIASRGSTACRRRSSCRTATSAGSRSISSIRKAARFCCGLCATPMSSLKITAAARWRNWASAMTYFPA